MIEPYNQGYYDALERLGVTQKIAAPGAMRRGAGMLKRMGGSIKGMLGVGPKNIRNPAMRSGSRSVPKAPTQTMRSGPGGMEAIGAPKPQPPTTQSTLQSLERSQGPVSGPSRPSKTAPANFMPEDRPGWSQSVGVPPKPKGAPTAQATQAPRSDGAGMLASKAPKEKTSITMSDAGTIAQGVAPDQAADTVNSGAEAASSAIEKGKGLLSNPWVRRGLLGAGVAGGGYMLGRGDQGPSPAGPQQYYGSAYGY